MKTRILFLLLVGMATLSGCLKERNTPAPALPSLSTQSVNSKSGIATINIDTAKYAINFAVNTQTAKTSVTGATLTIVYTEDVNLLLLPKDYNSSWAVHLLDDFSSSALKDFDYTTVTQDGNVTFDWVDDNLNNITTKKASDTTINNIKLTKLNVARTFTFSKTYSGNADAVSEQNVLLSTKNDILKYSSFYLMPAGFTTTYNGSAAIDYTR